MSEKGSDKGGEGGYLTPRPSGRILWINFGTNWNPRWTESVLQGRVSFYWQTKIDFAGVRRWYVMSRTGYQLAEDSSQLLLIQWVVFLSIIVIMHLHGLPNWLTPSIVITLRSSEPVPSIRIIPDDDTSHQQSSHFFDVVLKPKIPEPNRPPSPTQLCRRKPLYSKTSVLTPVDFIGWPSFSNQYVTSASKTPAMSLINWCSGPNAIFMVFSLVPEVTQVQQNFAFRCGEVLLPIGMPKPVPSTPASLENRWTQNGRCYKCMR